MRYLIQGPLESDYSLAIVNRLLAYALLERGIDLTLHERDSTSDYETSDNFAVEHPRLAARLVRNPGHVRYDVHSRYIYPPHTDRMFGDFDGVHCYGWEESTFPPRYAEWFNDGVDFVTTMSDYTADVLRRAGVKVPVFNVGLGADHILSVPAVDGCDITRGGTFDFLHVSSCFPRKGVDVLIEAFARAFNRNQDVRLIIKTFPNPHNRVQEQVQEAHRKYPSHAPIVVIDTPLQAAGNLRWLYENTDCLVAPSRGEGFGLPAAEAMMLRRPVIATAYSGHAEFCDDSTCWVVQHRIAPAASHLSEGSSTWGEPSVDSLEAQMRAVRSAKPEHLRRKLDAAHRRVAEKFTWAKVAERQLAVVEEVRRRANFVVAAQGSPGPRAAEGHKPDVGIVTSWNCRCGIAENSRYLVSAFPQLGLDYAVFASATDALVRPDEPSVRRCWKQGYESPSRFRDLLRQIIGSGVRLVSLQYNSSLLTPAALDFLADQLQQHGVRVAVTMHSVRPEEFPSLREALGRAEAVIVHRRRDLDFLRSNGVQNVRLLPIGNPPPRAPRERSGEGWFSVATFGFLLPFKGIYELLVAFACALKINPRMRLHLCTALYPVRFSSTYARACQELIQQFHLSSRVTLDTRFLEDEGVVDRLAESDLIVLPYIYSTESASAAVRLPLASMRPVLCADLAVFDDVADLVHRYPAGDTAALARRLVSFSRRPLELTSREAAQYAFTERLSWPNVSGEFADFCLALIEGGATNDAQIVIGQAANGDHSPNVRIDLQ